MRLQKVSTFLSKTPFPGVWEGGQAQADRVILRVLCPWLFFPGNPTESAQSGGAELVSAKTDSVGAARGSPSPSPPVRTVAEKAGDEPTGERGRPCPLASLSSPHLKAQNVTEGQTTFSRTIGRKAPRSVKRPSRRQTSARVETSGGPPELSS